MLQHYYDGFTYHALKEVSCFNIHNRVMICENCKNYIPSKFVSIWYNMIDIDVLVNHVYFVTKLLANLTNLKAPNPKMLSVKGSADCH